MKKLLYSKTLMNIAYWNIYVTVWQTLAKTSLWVDARMRCGHGCN